MTIVYCDIADINLIKKFNKKKIVKGFTTNPSLMRKAGAKNYLNYSKKILEITKKPVSFEVFADDINSMIKQGQIISKLGKNVFVKVPIKNSKGEYTSKVIRELNKNLVLILILLNLISWVISYDFLKFEYKNDDICAPKHAISASLEFKFTKGALKNFFDTRKNIRCWVNIDSERGRRILDGKSTKIPQKNVE